MNLPENDILTPGTRRQKITDGTKYMNKKQVKKIIIISTLLLLVYLVNQYSNTPFVTNPGTPPKTYEQVVKAYNQKKSDIQVKGAGTIVKLLSDDLQGSKHQRFLVKVNDQQTLLISHNIDLAPRIDTLREGEKIEFFGEYVWNKKGGIIHWTHHDPNKHHIDGWLKFRNKLYQ